MNIKGIIYKVTNIKNGKVYIGQTIRGLEKRKKCHLYSAFSKNKKVKDYYFCRALRKWGKENFIWEVLCTVNIEDLNILEKMYIFLYHSFVGHDKTNKERNIPGGYNSTFGGENFPGYINYEQKQRAEEIRNLFITNNFTCKQLAYKFNVSDPTIKNIINNKTYPTEDVFLLSKIQDTIIKQSAPLKKEETLFDHSLDINSNGLSNLEILKIIRLYKHNGYYSIINLSKKFNISQSTIKNIIKRKEIYKKELESVEQEIKNKYNKMIIYNKNGTLEQSSKQFIKKLYVVEEYDRKELSEIFNFSIQTINRILSFTHL